MPWPTFWRRRAEKGRGCRVIAFYLPQFHPIPENDEWWGDGFTEWTNVRRAEPQYNGHIQPRQPAELGYYDLRDVEVQKRQAELARAFGVHGFCYHYYWFNGRRLLDRPLWQLLNEPGIDLPFCVCWANENWTRRWDGRADDVLLAQTHTPEDDIAFLDGLAPFLEDPRYIRIDERPLIMVYRPMLLPDAAATAGRWRERAHQMGLDGLYLVAGLSLTDVADPRAIGFDAAVEFPPHQYPLADARKGVEGLAPDFSGRILDYEACVTEGEERLRRKVPFRQFPAVMPGWDNTPRRGRHATVFAGSTPALFSRWVQAACRRAARVKNANERLVFVNAWNEWGEGAYLEPDASLGNARLVALRDAVDLVNGNGRRSDLSR